MTEIELAQKFIEYFSEGYDIFKEVPAYGIIDFVAKQGVVTIGVEVKTSLNFRVIEQAFKNKNYCTYSYIAVPQIKEHHFGYKICADYGIGILEYRNVGNPNFSDIIESIKPKLNRYSKFYKLRLEEYMKQSIAGSQNDRITAFGNTIKEMASYIKRHPGCSLKQCLENVGFHWKNITSAKSSVTKWIAAGVIKEFKIENGILVLNK